MRGVNALPLKSPVAADVPIRGELYSTERLEEHAESLAAEHAVYADRRTGRRLLPRLAENGKVLLECYRVIAGAVREESAISPAAEGLDAKIHVQGEQRRLI